MKKLNLLAIGVKTALFAGAVTASGFAMAADEETVEKVERIQVTGSRIKRSDMEGAAPIISITAADLTDKGFVTAYDAIQSLSAATGTNQGQAFGGFTANAETVNFRGLGPNRTLVLLNGKRVANYPRAYNGQNNVFNLATIPMAAIQRIDIVTGGQSAIYGSDAIAGVMNIITKRGVEETTLNIGGSTTAHGGANNKKISLVTGGQSNDFNWTLALDHDVQDALMAKERSWLDDRFDRPSDIKDYPEHALVMPRTLMAMQFDDGWKYLDPGKEACDQFDSLQHANRPSRGYYCGVDASGTSTMINGRKNSSIYFNSSYEINDDHQFNADILFWNSDSEREGSQFWDTRFLRDEIVEGPNYLGSGYFYTPGDGNYNYLQRTFQPQEMFGKGNTSKFDEQMLTTTLSFTGTVLEDYDYEVFASYSQSKDEQSGYRVKKEVGSDYFVAYDAESGAPSINWDRWFTPLDEAGFNEIFGLNNSESDSSVLTTGANITGDLYELPAGAVAFSALVEYEKSEYDINVNPRTLGKEGQGWAGLTGTEGSGERARTAIALELSVPVIDGLLLNLAARYDNYNDDTQVGGAPTYQVGVEYRPVDELLLRANWGTTFRAPDLHNVFKDPSGSYSSVTDYTLVASCNAIAEGNPGGVLIPGADIDSLTKTCTEDFNESYTVFGVSQGEKNLKEETGESLTIGFVWQPLDNLSMTFDVYNILMEDAVRTYPTDRVMRQERDCLAGTEDINSNLCKDTFSRLDRYADTGFNTSYKVRETRSSFINAAMQEQTGFDFQLDYDYEIADFGVVGFKTEYSHVLKTERQTFTGDEIEKDYRDDYLNSEFRSKVTNSLSYDTDEWHFVLTQYRYGSLPNDVDEDDWTQVEKRRYAPLFMYNLGVSYEINSSNLIRLGVNNLMDSRARYDASEQGSPYFNIFAYPSTAIIKGREFTLNYTVTF
ncbi:TonB-dependent receptor plug domain-containing protein [Pseudoalteromonas ulvae]|uniref:TonB-dependent receptor n=1 Tax=Pseudoalteromonas ulvae TaxID=107327 RepID=A0A244CP08_PSEDV|nr:TonB-dependent receptor [Pseudoalteromonas ulvae]OUL57353.1 hypothetical protein B1199_14405 [Pseudoalteromonas ulvae]